MWTGGSTWIMSLLETEYKPFTLLELLKGRVELS